MDKTFTDTKSRTKFHPRTMRSSPQVITLITRKIRPEARQRQFACPVVRYERTGCKSINSCYYVKLPSVSFAVFVDKTLVDKTSVDRKTANKISSTNLVKITADNITPDSYHIGVKLKSKFFT